MKTIEITYYFRKSITVEIPKKKRNKKNLVDSLASGDYAQFYVKVIDGLDEFIKHALKNANDKSSCRGNWYLHFNGYCLDAIITRASKKESCIFINTYFNYRKSCN